MLRLLSAAHEAVIGPSGKAVAMETVEVESALIMTVPPNVCCSSDDPAWQESA